MVLYSYGLYRYGLYGCGHNYMFMAYIVMAYMFMAYIVMAYSYGPYSSIHASMSQPPHMLGLRTCGDACVYAQASAHAHRHTCLQHTDMQTNMFKKLSRPYAWTGGR